MQQSVVTARVARQTVSPAATMTTLASPTVGGSAALSLWRVEMSAGSQGPLHTMSTEQLWTVLAGAATITLADTPLALAAGDTLAIPGGVTRQIIADQPVTFLVCGASNALPTTAANPAGVIPPWIQ